MDLAYVISCQDYFMSWHNDIRYIVAALLDMLQFERQVHHNKKKPRMENQMVSSWSQDYMSMWNRLLSRNTVCLRENLRHNIEISTHVTHYT